jgi:hypothetical protein
VPWHAGCLARRGLLHLAPTRSRLLHLCHTSGCLGTSRDLSCGLLSTTSPRTCSPSTTSPTPCVRVPRHVARLVVDHFAYTARPGASARHAARRAAHRAAHHQLVHHVQARCRVLHPHRASECLGASRGLSSTMLTVYIRIKVHMDLQADKCSVIVKGPFFPRVVNPRYRIRGTMCNARIQSSKARKSIL